MANEFRRLTVALSGSSSVTADTSATTSSCWPPAREPVPSGIIGGERALTLRTFPEALKLRSLLVPRARLIVVGAGFIGLELAASARQRGCQVTVIELAERVMSRLVPAGVAERIAQRHRAAGVEVHCGAGISRIDVSSSGYRVVLDSGEVFVCDLVVAGVGAVPNVELAATAGLSIENGIRVDETLATSDPAIYAAGDCCSFPHPAYGGRRVRLEAWRNAQDQAATVAGNLLGHRRPYDAVPWFWSDQYELGLQIAGLPDSATTEVVRLREDGGLIHFGLDGSMALVAASGIAKGTGIARDIRLCQTLISRRIALGPPELADPTVPLKSLLNTPSTAGPQGRAGTDDRPTMSAVSGAATRSRPVHKTGGADLSAPASEGDGASSGSRQLWRAW